MAIMIMSTSPMKIHSQNGQEAITPLVLGIVCMVMIATLQYGWNLFVNPIDKAHHWGRASIQVAFSLFVLAETWLVPVESWFVDRFGPRSVVGLGGVLVALAWSLNSVGSSIPLVDGGA